MRRRAVVWSAALAISASLAATTAGCGGGGGAADNGVAAKRPNAILGAATNAIHGAQSVHVSGSVVHTGTPIALDLHLVAGKGGTGRLSEHGWSVRIIVLKQTAYFNGGNSFWRHFGGGFAAQLLQGKWLKAPASGDLSSLTRLFDLQKLFNLFLSNHHGVLVKGGTSTVDGQSVVAVKDAGTNGTLYVATKGKPYPVQIAKSGSEGGHLSFDRYDEPVPLSAPAHAIQAP
jgi:hypothetical protein